MYSYHHSTVKYKRKEWEKEGGMEERRKEQRNKENILSLSSILLSLPSLRREVVPQWCSIPFKSTLCSQVIFTFENFSVGDLKNILSPRVFLEVFIFYKQRSNKWKKCCKRKDLIIDCGNLYRSRTRKKIIKSFHVSASECFISQSSYRHLQNGIFHSKYIVVSF